MAISMKSTDEMKAFEERFIDEVWNGREFDLFEESVADDYVGYWFTMEGDADRDGFREFIEEVHAGFSDFRMAVEFMLAEDDLVAVGFVGTGTHDGEFMGIPATGKSGETPGIFVHRFDEAGRVVEAWATWDALGLLQQVGVVPESFTLSSFLETGAKLAKQDVLKLTRRD